MSKKKLIELIEMDDEDISNEFKLIINHHGYDGIREMLLQALKDAVDDTRHGCAEKINSMGAWIVEANSLIDQYQASSACLNYRDKDLEGL